MDYVAAEGFVGGLVLRELVLIPLVLKELVLVPLVDDLDILE
jgi:hypothetical protein